MANRFSCLSDSHMDMIARAYQAMYALPLTTVVWVMALLLAGFAICRACCLLVGWEIVWRRLNQGLTVLSVVAILTAVFANREVGEYRVILRPFASFAAARIQPEYYREMLMNVFLFVPLGLTLGSAWPERWGKGRRLGMTVLCGAILSLSIECFQGLLSVGTAETDDWIRNVCGTLWGACHLALADAGVWLINRCGITEKKGK